MRKFNWYEKTVAEFFMGLVLLISGHGCFLFERSKGLVFPAVGFDAKIKGVLVMLWSLYYLSSPYRNRYKEPSGGLGYSTLFYIVGTSTIIEFIVHFIITDPFW